MYLLWEMNSTKCGNNTTHRDYWFSEVLMFSESLVIVTQIEISVRKSAFGVANILSAVFQLLLSYQIKCSLWVKLGLSGEINNPGNTFFPFYFLCSPVLMEVCSYGHTECISFMASFKHFFTLDFSSSLCDPDTNLWLLYNPSWCIVENRSTNSWRIFSHKSRSM